VIERLVTQWRDEAERITRIAGGMDDLGQAVILQRAATLRACADRLERELAAAAP
jgi:hypothetical protein